ncbi:hypothetical protein FJL53_22340 [Salmonella enterica subsp. enterica]|uniref:hypothetical protein n=1 Tax=Citrobacter sp. XY323 TaxID=2976537 RepID=UPI00218258EC|nr:hypothetical protein [Citrobacter sp. XY323]EBG8282926.1 hypothetical protein [Salmonella enterica subsp. enterica serovar Muenchen]MCS8554263.1 hypothetical protein [Citrobacter sp. XY323]
MKPFNIEKPSETKIAESVGFFDCLNATATGHIGYFAGNPAHARALQSITPEMGKSVFRDNASVMYIGETYKGNPAFKDWSQRLTLGEKLPRGKYFRREERIRALLNTRLDTVKITTFHVQ